ncbi:MAG: hypothetical protein JWQ48_2516 [Conexibacter sp.]|nr:hypothetical protein [Conexibacter sp.]
MALQVSVGYSKKQVNKAGQMWRARSVGRAWAEEELDQFVAAVDAIDWWRARHARPLARVNAGLRYYIRRAGVARRSDVPLAESIRVYEDRLRD